MSRYLAASESSNAPVSVELIKSGLPVTVHYVKEGDALVARKVIVKRKMAKGPVEKTTRTETKTTTTMGTVNEFSPERIIVRTETAADPITYRFNKTTTYVDESGAPVSVELIKSGLPVTIHYTTEGDSRIASKVVVRRKVVERR